MFYTYLAEIMIKNQRKALIEEATDMRLIKLVKKNQLRNQNFVVKTFANLLKLFDKYSKGNHCLKECSTTYHPV